MTRKKTTNDAAHIFFDNDVDFATRTIYIGGELDIDDVAIAIYIKAMHLLNAADRQAPINIILNSPGGDVVQGFALVDFMSQLENPIHIMVYGQCYSMAVAILQAGTSRVIAEHAAVLIHDGFSAVEGYNKNTLKNWAKFTDQLDIWYEELLLERIREKQESFSKKKLQSMMTHDTILTAREAVDLGLADGIIGDEDEEEEG